MNLTTRLDDLEDTLPRLPSRTLALGRASARRTTSVATALVNDVSERAEAVAATSSTAARTVVGQARSATNRTASAARRGAAEVSGQFDAQADRVAVDTSDTVAAAVGDATAAVRPEPSTRSELAALSKQDLYERAQALDVSGRSTMTKQQLVDAIVAA